MDDRTIWNSVTDLAWLYFESHQVRISCSMILFFFFSSSMDPVSLIKKKKEKTTNQTLSVYSCLSFRARLTSRHCSLLLKVITSWAAATKGDVLESFPAQIESSSVSGNTAQNSAAGCASLSLFQECDRTQRANSLLFLPFLSFFLIFFLSVFLCWTRFNEWKRAWR